MKKWCFLVLISTLALTGCGKESQTENIILDWGTALNLYLTSGGNDGDFSFPNRLSDLDEDLKMGLSEVDAWGNKLFYRRLQDNYHLISAGADGELGNEDDIVMEKGMLYDAATVYARIPLNR